MVVYCIPLNLTEVDEMRPLEAVLVAESFWDLNDALVLEFLPRMGNKFQSTQCDLTGSKRVTSGLDVVIGHVNKRMKVFHTWLM